MPGEGRELCTPQNEEDVPRELLPGRTMPRHSSGLQCRGISQPSPSAASVLAKNHRNRLVWSRTAWATPAALRLLARSRGVEALSKLAPAKIGSGAWLSPGERLGKEKLFGARRSWGPRGTSALPSEVCRAPRGFLGPSVPKPAAFLHFGQAARQKRSVTLAVVLVPLPTRVPGAGMSRGAPRGFGESPSLPKSPPGELESACQEPCRRGVRCALRWELPRLRGRRKNEL